MKRKRNTSIRHKRAFLLLEIVQYGSLYKSFFLAFLTSVSVEMYRLSRIFIFFSSSSSSSPLLRPSVVYISRSLFLSLCSFHHILYVLNSEVAFLVPIEIISIVRAVCAISIVDRKVIILIPMSIHLPHISSNQFKSLDCVFSGFQIGH